MSTYSTSEAALLAVVRAAGGYTAQNSSRGDYTVLDRAGVTTAAVLWQAGKSEFGDDLDDGAHGERQQRHKIGVLLFQARAQADDGTTAAALHTACDALVTYLDRFPRLNNTTGVQRADAIEADVPRVYQGRAWVYQAVVVEIVTAVTPDWEEIPE